MTLATGGVAETVTALRNGASFDSTSQEYTVPGAGFQQMGKYPVEAAL